MYGRNTLCKYKMICEISYLGISGCLDGKFLFTIIDNLHSQWILHLIWEYTSRYWIRVGIFNANYVLLLILFLSHYSKVSLTIPWRVSPGSASWLQGSLLGLSRLYPEHRYPPQWTSQGWNQSEVCLPSCESWQYTGCIHPEAYFFLIPQMPPYGLGQLCTTFHLTFNCWQPFISSTVWCGSCS